MRVQGVGFTVQGVGFKVQVPGFRVQGSGSRVQGAGCRVQGSGLRVQGSGCRVQSSGFSVEREELCRRGHSVPACWLFGGSVFGVWGSMLTVILGNLIWGVQGVQDFGVGNLGRCPLRRPFGPEKSKRLAMKFRATLCD